MVSLPSDARYQRKTVRRNAPTKWKRNEQHMLCESEALYGHTHLKVFNVHVEIFHCGEDSIILSDVLEARKGVRSEVKPSIR